MTVFLALGVFIGSTGSLLIAWQYHLTTEPRLIGLHFLSLNAGYVIAVAASQPLLQRFSIRSVALTALALGTVTLCAMSLLVPPAEVYFRVLGLALLGSAGGLLASALLHAVQPCFDWEPVTTASRAGVFFGAGCLVATVTVAISYLAGSVQIETPLLALVPLLFFVLCARNKFPASSRPVEVSTEDTGTRETLRDLRRVGAVLFALLLFFQFGNEWAIAGWLPLFLIHRLGANPVWAIFALGWYFLVLLLGRLLARKLLSRINHRKLLLASVSLAMIGYLFLSLSDWMLGAWVAAAFVALGFAPIYPLVAQTLDDRFSYNPGFYISIFSIAITGGMSSPWLLGYVDAYWGTQYVMLLPAFGSIVVLLLVLLIMLEVRVMSDKTEDRSDPPPKTLAATGGR